MVTSASQSSAVHTMCTAATFILLCVLYAPVLTLTHTRTVGGRYANASECSASKDPADAIGASLWSPVLPPRVFNSREASLRMYRTHNSREKAQGRHFSGAAAGILRVGLDSFQKGLELQLQLLAMFRNVARLTTRAGQPFPQIECVMFARHPSDRQYANTSPLRYAQERKANDCDIVGQVLINNK